MITWKAHQKHSDLTTSQHLHVFISPDLIVFDVGLMSLLGLDRHEMSHFHFGGIPPEIQLRLVLHEWGLVTGVQFRSSAWPVRLFYSSWNLWVIFASINHEGRTSFWSVWRWMSALSLASGQEPIPALVKGTFNSSGMLSLSLSDSCAAQRLWTGIAGLELTHEIAGDSLLWNDSGQNWAIVADVLFLIHLCLFLEF